MPSAFPIHLLLCILLIPTLSVAADSASTPTIAGRWSDSESRSGDEFTFYGTGHFALTYQRKDVPVTKRLDGAYQLSNDVCNSGDAKGNLWIVAGSTRCCYKAYFLADTLVLDAVGNTISTIAGTCKARTLKKQLPKKGESS